VKKPKRTDLTLRERIAFGIGGLFALLYGYGQILRGNAIHNTWSGVDTRGHRAMAFGAILVGTAVFPWGRLRFLWDDGGKKRKH